MHQKLGIDAQNILFNQTKFIQVTLNLSKVFVTQIACSEFHTLALTDKGLVYSWGGTLGGKRGDSKGRTQGNKFEPTLLQYFIE
jgi:alpha-tubulin suppressor-like RCC1 family protein